MTKILYRSAALALFGFALSAAPSLAQPLALAPTLQAPSIFDSIMRNPQPHEATEPEEGTPDIPANLRRQVISYAGHEAAGTIIVDTPNT